MGSTTITAEQWRAYQTDGVMRLPGAVPAWIAEGMADRLWDFLDQERGLRRGARETWTDERPAQFQKLEKSGAFNDLATPVVRDVVDGLLGAGRWSEPDGWGHPLVTFPRPQPGGWRVPHQHWHLDHAVGRPDVARLFVFLDEVRPSGGGTVYVRGSHQLVAALGAKGLVLKSADVRKRLGTHPWFARLWSPEAEADRKPALMEDGTSMDGVDLAVAEMTGGPGDVMVMHPLMLHAMAANVLDRPRLMLTQWVYARP